MAFYRPTYLLPDGTAINPATPNTFSWQINSSGNSMETGEVKIYTLTNTLIATIPATPTVAVEDKERGSVPVASGTLTAGTQYKWVVTPDSTAATPLWSKETQFYVYAQPTIVFSATPSTITEKSYEFQMTYTQAQSIGIKKWKMIWYDSTSVIIEDSGWQSTGSLKYTFDGFGNGETYSVKGFIENQVGTEIETAVLTFVVAYAPPSLNVRSSITIDNETSAITSSWVSAIQISGTPTGTYSYINDFLYTDAVALELETSASILFDVDIPLIFCGTFLIWLPVGFDGLFCQIGDTYDIGYDDTQQRFYSDLNGYIIYSDVYDLTDNVIYMVGVFPTNILIREAGVY